MTRKIKRLLDRSASPHLSVARRIQREPEAWGKELAWWRGVGVDARILITLLESMRVERNQYEERLEARVHPLTTRDIGHARRALKSAGPLIRLLKTEPSVDGPGPPELFFGDLGEQIERSVQNYIDTLRPPLAAHRPDDPWLRKGVLVLARWLMSRPPVPVHRPSRPSRQIRDPFIRDAPRLRPARWVRQSERRTRRAIEGVFKLAGHGDVVTADKIRHILRKKRR